MFGRGTNYFILAKSLKRSIFRFVGARGPQGNLLYTPTQAQAPAYESCSEAEPYDFLEGFLGRSVNRENLPVTFLRRAHKQVFW